MLLQMFELLNRLKEGGADVPQVTFELYPDTPRMAVKISAMDSDGERRHLGRPFTGEELLILPLDDAGQLDRMSKAFLIELNRTHKPA
jgi:hypothetical protein